MKIFKAFLFGAAVILLSAPAFAASKEYRIDAAKSEVLFKVRAPGITISGKAKEAEGKVLFDPNTGKAELPAGVEIPVKSLTTKNRLRDRDMRKMFEAEKFPSLAWKAASLDCKPAEKDRFFCEASGTLNMHGVEKTVAFPMTLHYENNEVKAEGSLELNTTDYGLNPPKLLGMVKVSPNVKIEFRTVWTTWTSLPENEKIVLDSILSHWETWVPAKKENGTAPLISFKELYEGLNEEQKAFLDKVRAIHPSDLDFDPKLPFKKMEGQTITSNGKPEVISPQYLPQDVYEAYEKMMEAMKKDLGRRLYVESGYRSPAYQLYTFLYYTPKHNYSLGETNTWVALPGHSEHGNPKLQASDFINEQGINGDSDRGQTQADFEKLPEYEWLQKNAGNFGFVLSYPRGTKGTNFEPWHWRYERSK